MKRLFGLAGVLALASIGTAADTFQDPTGLGVRLGWVYPIDSVARNAVRNFIGFGVDADLSGGLVENAVSNFSIDWLAKSASGAKGNIFILSFNQKFYRGEMLESGGGRNYFSMGAGVAVVDINRTDTVWAIRATAGQEFTASIFGEITFVYSDVGGGARATSLGAYIGYRF